MTDVTAEPTGPVELGPVETAYGVVYSDRITFFEKKGWFSGGVQEDLAIRHITSVKLEVVRNIIGGIFLVVLGVVCLLFKAIGLLLALVFFALAILTFWGTPTVRVHTAGGESRPARGAPWTKDEAERYVAAVRKALFAKP